MSPNKINPLFKNTPPGYDPTLLIHAIAASSASILITDNCLPDNPIVYCNLSFEKVTGYSAAEAIGKNCRFLQGKYQEKEQRKLIREALNSGEDIVIELRNQKKNRVMFWNELHISPVKNESGATTHFIGIQHDITERKNNDRSPNPHSPTVPSPIKETPITIKVKELLTTLKLLLPFK